LTKYYLFQNILLLGTLDTFIFWCYFLTVRS
jgi:hypothetical protein